MCAVRVMKLSMSRTWAQVRAFWSVPSVQETTYTRIQPHLESNDEIEKPPSVDIESSDYHIRPAETSSLRGKRRFSYVAKLALLVATLVFFIAVFAYLRIAVEAPQNTKCVDPVRRREWRQLNSTERSDYITAVKCLHDLTSRVSGHAKLSDDFGWTHSMAGTYSID
jgi:hypothetical protein